MSDLSQVAFLLFPRIALVLVYLNSDYVQNAYRGLLIPLVGFLFLPLTVLAYAFLADIEQTTTGIGYLVLIGSLTIDLGSIFVGFSNRRRG
jgi:hypothetical protein